MTIWGLIIGGATGFAFGGPIGALLGAAAGTLAGQQLRRHLDPEQNKKVAFTVAVIALSAKMARADGVVTVAEIKSFRQRVQIPEADLHRVGQFWDLARQTQDGFEAYARQTVSLFGPKSAILEQLLDLLFTIARSDGHITDPEWDYLRKVANIFGYSADEFHRLSDIYSGANPPPHLVLGVSAQANLDEVRLAWRKLAAAHHPDKLIAAGMPEEFIQAATDRLARINNAYDLLSKQRAASNRPI
jgi:DnaJ like chaperone protein